MSTVLVTGGAGFIGSHICEHLLKNGYSVRVLDNFSSGKEENISHLANRIQIVEGDITNYNDLCSAVSGCDIVVHLAAIVSVAHSFKNPELVHNTNVVGTLMLLKEAEKVGVRKFIFASSCAVYGDNSDLLSEDSALSPLSPYAMSKYIGEQYTLLLNKAIATEAIVLRLFNVFGPRQEAFSPYAGVIAGFTNKMLQSEPLVIYGDGEQTRDFIFVGDVAQAIIKVIMTKKTNTNVINIASGASGTVNDIAASIGDIFSVQPLVVYREPREGDIRHSLACIRILKEQFDFNISMPFNEGLQHTIDWYNNQIRCAKGGAML